MGELFISAVMIFFACAVALSVLMGSGALSCQGLVEERSCETGLQHALELQIGAFRVLSDG